MEWNSNATIAVMLAIRIVVYITFLVTIYRLASKKRALETRLCNEKARSTNFRNRLEETKDTLKGCLAELQQKIHELKITNKSVSALERDLEKTALDLDAAKNLKATMVELLTEKDEKMSELEKLLKQLVPETFSHTMSLSDVFWKSSHCRKLNPEKVRQIRKLAEAGQMTRQEIADKFAVSKRSIFHVLSGKTWSDVK